MDNDCDPTTLNDDLDGDGYPVATDCDDHNSAVNPGVIEVDGDGLDNDCNPSTLDGPDTEAPTLYWRDFNPDLTNGGETPSSRSGGRLKMPRK